MEFDINGKKYRAGKLNAFQQQDLAVALLPIVPALRPIWDNLKPSGVDENGKPIFSLDNMADIITPLAEAVRTLGKESRYEINDICLSVVSREAGGAWAGIYTGQQL
ncbi:phage tail assembly chaperone, partial [Xenorhabdus bovienii]|uniref:phage tail assembly chaperone n=1 Tax=Xenorhabdus bovienii TaxID=40576 RepID=UPI0023B2983B